MAVPLLSHAGLSFDGVSQYVTFGRATNLGAATFTLETWFNWNGAGVPTTTGSGGTLAIPLIAKLSPEADGDNRDGNYFLGIRPAGALLVADMEEAATGAAPGTNHPVIGVSRVTTNVWHHAAVTYDGAHWLVFLDGKLETRLAVRQPPRWDTIQHAALASSLNSTGSPQGYFSGLMDEARVWNYARTAGQIAESMNAQIPAAPGLIGRWALDETSGARAHDTSGHGVDGRLVHGPAWTNGYRAAGDVITPVKLTAIDPVRTEALRQAEAGRVAPMFRFDAAIAKQVETSFRAGFRTTREKFLAARNEAFPKRGGDAKWLNDARLARVVTTFQLQNEGLPVSIALARTWALEQPDDRIEADLAGKLREVMGRYVRPDILPDDARSGPANVRVISMSLGGAVPELDSIEKQSLNVWRTNVLSLSKARAALRQSFPTNEQAVATYLAGFVQENCVFESELTRLSRARSAGALFVADHYEAGEVIVKQGQMITVKIKAALDELKAGTAAEAVKARATTEEVKAQAAADRIKAQATAEEIKAQAAAERLKADAALRDVEQKAAVAEFKSDHFGQQNRWLLGGLLIVAVASSLAVWQLARPKRQRNLLPAPIQHPGEAFLADAMHAGVTVEPPGAGAEGLGAAEWKQRALSAEKRAEQASAVVRAGLLPHLAQWLKHKLVSKLMADRTHLLSTQEKAALELAQLEQRLARVQAPLEQRLRAYEERIAELERELAAKGEENRELIKAKIELTRKKLASEQGKDTVTWN